RQAAEQLLLSGHVDRGLVEIEGVLRALGLRLAATPRRALLSLVGTRIGLRLRGLRAARPGAPRLGSHDGAALRRLDALWAVSTGLSLIDNIRGADCQARFLREALRVGEPVRIARGLAMESGYVAAAGEGARAKAIALADRAHALADAQGDPYTLALVQLVRGIGSFVRGDFPQAIPACHQADVMLATSCVGVEWERTAAAFFRIGGTYFTGDLHALRREVPALLRAAIDRGNLYGATGLRVWYSNAAWLAADDPVAAQAATDEGRAGWSYAGYHLQHHYVALAQIQIALYRGDAATARTCASTAYRQLGVMRGLQMVRFEAHELLARSLLAVAAGGDRAATRQALRHARAVRGIDHPFTRGVGSAHVASALTLLGDPAGARAAWAIADQELERAGMRAHGAAARWRCALAADDPRAADAALDALAALGARAPDRFARMLMPGAPSP
ncbi:MAG: hypothetical protein K8W52_16845, partial [Deltaproteobacteria bacterium]|nr:hypothetical protein [Deltaproteobacteria bacterium]